jgi:hypothetical protein
MSKRINVNPDHYKVAGRERPGDAVANAARQHGNEEKARERWQRSQVRVRSERSTSKK